MDASWSAMGTTVHVVVHGGDERGLLDRARRHVDDLERAWSRFRATSEVSRATRAAGTAVPVGAATLVLVALARRAHHLTDGWFDATMAVELADWGYDRTFVDVRDLAQPPPSPPSTSTPPRPDDADELAVDPVRGTVIVPAGRGLDPGGIGKGLAADLVCRALLQAGATAACVNLGGDLRVGGVPPGRDAWVVGCDDDGVALRLERGGLATSTTDGRSWRVGPRRVSHLLDPRRRRPCPAGGSSATVVASSAWRAEVLATAATIRGGADVAGWVRQRGGRLVDRTAAGERHHGRGAA